MRYWLVVLLIVSFVLVGCNPGPPNLEIVNYYEGTDGLVMTFMDNSPPPTVFSQQYYPISVFIENKGAFSLRDYTGYSGALSDSLYANGLLIFDPFYFEEELTNAAAFEASRSRMFFEGKSPYWPEGESRMETIGMIRVKDLPQRISADAQLMVSLCYPYGTLLTREVCVDADPYNQDERMTGCESEDLFLPEGQGAPVAITEVAFESLPAGIQTISVTSQEPVTGPNGEFLGTRTVTRQETVTAIRPVFSLRIENVGDGQVVRARDFGVMRSCIKQPDEVYPTNSVAVRGQLGNRELICNPQVPVFFDNVAETICMVDEREDIVMTSNYKDILQLELAYVYQSRVVADMEIMDTEKQYEPLPEIPEYTCSDYNGDYLGCKTYGERVTTNGKLNCYYCESNDRCIDAGMCKSNCTGAPEPDPFDSRRCVGRCPLSKPSVSMTVDRTDGILEVSCSATNDNLDLQRCGCSQLWYKEVINQSMCDIDAGWTTELPGGIEGRGLTAYRTLNPEQLFSDIPLYACVKGVTTDGRVTMRSTRISS